MTPALEHLPESVRELSELVGLNAALKLVDRWGGQIALYVPQRVDQDHPLAQTLGLEAAQALSRHYGGDYLRNIPRAARAMRAARDKAVLKRRGEGASPARIAQEFGLTERWVWELLRRAKDAGPPQCRLPGLD
jgi:DNA-directed RNA polymerase specialized sigma24 family protein